jgi:hypothetical protein
MLWTRDRGDTPMAKFDQVLRNDSCGFLIIENHCIDRTKARSAIEFDETDSSLRQSVPKIDRRSHGTIDNAADQTCSQDIQGVRFTNRIFVRVANYYVVISRSCDRADCFYDFPEK